MLTCAVAYYQPSDLYPDFSNTALLGFFIQRTVSKSAVHTLSLVWNFFKRLTFCKLSSYLSVPHGLSNLSSGVIDFLNKLTDVCNDLGYLDLGATVGDGFLKSSHENRDPGDSICSLLPVKCEYTLGKGVWKTASQIHTLKWKQRHSKNTGLPFQWMNTFPPILIQLITPF